LVVVLASPLQAQDWKGMGRMEGKVTDDKGAPVAGATVKLERDGYGDGTTLKTDKKGRWAIAGIAAARWNADIEAAGYTPKKISVDLPSESSRLAPIEVKLEKAAAAGPPPEVAQALEKGEQAYKEGRFADARAEFEKLLALRPDLASTIHQRIGFAYIQEKQYAKGLDHLQKVLDAEPGNTFVRGIMAQAALEGGMLDRGLELLKGIDESTVKSPDLFFNIGVNFVNANKPEEAVTYFTKAVTVDPAYADGYFRRGLAYVGLGKVAEAKADLTKFLSLQPDGPLADMAKKALAQMP
jgi:tetratricopeptide (TPR) repeat protein